MVQVPSELVKYLVEKMVERAGVPAGDAAAEALRSEFHDQVVSVLGALADSSFVPVWAKIATTGKNYGGQHWEASISRRGSYGVTCNEALSALWESEVTHLPIPPRPCVSDGRMSHFPGAPAGS